MNGFNLKLSTNDAYNFIRNLLTEGQNFWENQFVLGQNKTEYCGNHSVPVPTQVMLEVSLTVKTLNSPSLMPVML